MYRFIASDLLVSGFQNNLDINENASISSTTIIGLALVRAFKENLSLIDSLRVMGNLYPLAGYSDDFMNFIIASNDSFELSDELLYSFMAISLLDKPLNDMLNILFKELKFDEKDKNKLMSLLGLFYLLKDDCFKAYEYYQNSSYHKPIFDLFFENKDKLLTDLNNFDDIDKRFILLMYLLTTNNEGLKEETQQYLDGRLLKIANL